MSNKKVWALTTPKNETWPLKSNLSQVTQIVFFQMNTIWVTWLRGQVKALLRLAATLYYNSGQTACLTEQLSAGQATPLERHRPTRALGEIIHPSVQQLFGPRVQLHKTSSMSQVLIKFCCNTSMGLLSQAYGTESQHSNGIKNVTMSGYPLFGRYVKA